jgi:hypothetical protein
MLRRLLAVLIVFSWVVLSGVDLLEDLRLETGTSAYGHRSGDRSVPPGLEQRLSLTNNIVESAASPEVFRPSIFRRTAVDSFVHPLFSFHRALALHKLNRVFLI